jgi:cellulose synthase/poly-beta-1,6-N-acetylglucosamine synthase-like glycosyltransferase
MTTGPTVSVTIPTYNRAELLRRALESVVQQTYEPLEIIVIDDGSTDHTAAVVADFGERVRYFRQANGGLGVARVRSNGRSCTSERATFARSVSLSQECVPSFPYTPADSTEPSSTKRWCCRPPPSSVVTPSAISVSRST